MDFSLAAAFLTPLALVQYSNSSLRRTAQATVCVSSIFFQFSVCSELAHLPSTRVTQPPTTLMSVTPQTCARLSLASSFLITVTSRLLVCYLFIIIFMSECCCVPDSSTEDVCTCLSTVDSYVESLQESVNDGEVIPGQMGQEILTNMVCGQCFRSMMVAYA